MTQSKSQRAGSRARSASSAVAGWSTRTPQRAGNIVRIFAVVTIVCATPDFAGAADPPPGYEPPHVRAGGFTIAPELDLTATFDSNVFATPNNAESDILFRVAPRVLAERIFGSGLFSAEAHGAFHRYADFTQENVDTYGANARVNQTISRGSVLTAGVAYDRTFERRDDPESTRSLGLSPANINIVSAEAAYQFRSGRFGIGGTFGITKSSYLDDLERDRDMKSYRTSFRGAIGISSRFDLFAEGYGNVRDFRLSQDRYGVNRDSKTLGVNLGTQIAIANLWTGEIGVGVFHVDPTDASLDSFSGLGANTSITWQPSQRTSVVASLFRGDVATVRQGAIGRIDSRARLALAQEVRHNLFMNVAVGYLEVSYRQSRNNLQRTVSAEAGLEYFVSRNIVLSLNILYAQRSATNSLESFERVQGVFGPRFLL